MLTGKDIEYLTNDELDIIEPKILKLLDKVKIERAKRLYEFELN